MPMRRRAGLVGGFALLTAMCLGAQARDSVRRPTFRVASRSRGRGNGGGATVHWGKWLPAGSAVAFSVMGAHEHSRSNGEFSQLLTLCRANNDDCLLGTDGTYLNPPAEQLYQTSIHFDRPPPLRLLARQATL